MNVTAIGLSGADAGNYSLASADASTTANVAKATISAVSGITAASKVYDGLVGAALDTGSAVLSGMVTGDILSVASATGAFANKNAGTGKTVTVSSIGLTGADAGNYNSFGGTSTALADITQRALTVDWSGTNKVYDGTTAAAVSNTDNRVTNDVLTVSNGGATFDNKNVSLGKTINVTGVSLSGTDAGNYSISNTGSASADVTAKSVGLALNGTASRTYDGSTAFNLVGLTASATGTIDGDAVSVGIGDVTGVTNKNVGTNKTVTFTGFTLSGADVGNYNLISGSAASNASITKADITAVTGITAASKVYDATTAATLTSTGANFTGKFGADELSVASASGAFSDKNATTGKTVTITGLSLGGADAGNYNLTSTAATTTADITKADITVVTGMTAADKVYDGTTLATLTSSSAGFTGRLGSDVLTVATAAGNFSDKTASTGKTVNITGLALGGGDAGNYNLSTTTASTTANINKAALTVAASAVSKTYDGTTTATGTGTVATLAGAGAGEVVNSSGSQVFLDKNAGIANKAVRASGVTIKDSGNADVSGNYTITYADNTASTINKADLTVTASAVTKTYDGTLAATGTGTVGALAGAGEAVLSAGNQAFLSKNAGTGDKTVRASGVTIKDSGDADVSGNYTIDYVDNTASTINKADITAVTGITASNKVYDALTTATLTSSSAGFTGRLGSDVLNVAAATGNFSDKAAATGKTVNITAIALGGSDAGNYNLSTTTASTTADISKATITALTGVTASDKVYDGSTSATLITSGAGLTGMLTGDNLSLVSASGSFADKNVGSGKNVSISNAILAGTDAGNYIAVGATTSASANITRLSSVAWIGGTTGNWFDPANWAGGAVPDLANVANVVIPAGVTARFDSATVVAPTQAGAVSIDSLGAAGGLAMTAGTLAVTNNLALANYTQSGGSVATGGNFTVSNSFSQSAGSIASTGNVGITQSSGGVNLGNITAGGTLGVAAQGDISQSAGSRLLATGASTLSSAAGNIALSNAGNDFVGAIYASGANVALADTNGITLANVTSTGTFGVTAAGNISQTSSSVIAATGATTLASTNGNIALSNVTNDFVGAINASGANVALADTNGITLGNVTSTGTFGVTAAGDVTQTSSSVIAATGATTLASTSGNIALDNASNNFGAAVNAQARQIALASSSNLVLGNIAATGDFTARSASGNVSQSSGSTLAVTGSQTVTAPNGVVTGDLLPPVTAPVVPTPVVPEPVVPTPVVPGVPTPVTPTPVAPTPVTPEPVAPAPVAPAPVTPAPVVPTPVAPAPVAPTPVAPASVVPTPVAPPPVVQPQAPSTVITPTVQAVIASTQSTALALAVASSSNSASSLAGRSFQMPVLVQPVIAPIAPTPSTSPRTTAAQGQDATIATTAPASQTAAANAAPASPVSTVASNPISVGGFQVVEISSAQLNAQIGNSQGSSSSSSTQTSAPDDKKASNDAVTLIAQNSNITPGSNTLFVIDGGIRLPTLERDRATQSINQNQ